jgi:hypothetical protein
VSWPEALAVLSRADTGTLLLAMPQLAACPPGPEPAGRPTRRISRTACSRCTRGRGAGPHVTVHTTHEEVLCPRHQLWTGDGNTGAPTQIRLDTCPEILAAYRHHRNLITRSGRHAVTAAFETASLINWRWYEQFGHFTAFADRYTALTASGDIPQQARSAVVAAALYPSVVDLTSALASPYWAELALSPNPVPFLERVSSQITDGWIPQSIGDPLRRWMTAERTARRLAGSGSTPGAPATARTPDSPVLGQL